MLSSFPTSSSPHFTLLQPHWPFLWFSSQSVLFTRGCFASGLLNLGYFFPSHIFQGSVYLLIPQRRPRTTTKVAHRALSRHLLLFSLQNLSLLGSLCSCVCELSLPFLPPGSGSHWALTWYGDHVSPSPGISETSWSTPPSDLLYYSSLLTGYQEDANEDGWESLEVIPTILSFQSNLDVISYKDSPHYLPHLNSIAVNMKRKMNTLLPIKDLCLAFQI